MGTVGTGNAIDVVIGGGGIIGLSLALELAASGLRVTVLEQGAAMREASWAAAGMLAAHDPENPPALRELSELSLSLYPNFLARVEELSKLAVPLRTAGTLQGSHAGAWGSRDGRSQSPLSRDILHGEAARASLPDLLPGSRSFAWLEEQSLDPRDLCAALPLAVRAAGVRLLEQQRVRAVVGIGDRVLVETESAVHRPGEYVAAHYVHCCGAWSNDVAPEMDGPVEPRKGQMVTVTLDNDAPGLPCVLRTPELYLVPRDASSRSGRRVVVGATVERTAFDRSTTQAAADGLLAAAAELWPPIRRGRVTEHWSGLRPWAPDSLPILGPMGRLWAVEEPERGEAQVSVAPRCWIATAHYRNGILLAPGTARVLCQLITGQMPAVPLDAFRASRFATVGAAS